MNARHYIIGFSMLTCVSVSALPASAQTPSPTDSALPGEDVSTAPEAPPAQSAPDVAARPRSAASVAEPPAPLENVEPASALEAAIEGTRSATRTLVQNLSDEFLKFVVRTAESLDTRGIVKPEHREAMMVPAGNVLVDTLVARFAAYEVVLTTRWAKAAPALAPGIVKMLEAERDRLEEFLRADPAIIERIAKEATPPTTQATTLFMERVAEATAIADSGPGFTKRLQRAKIACDCEVERVVRRRVRMEAGKVADGIADGYVAFIVAAENALNKQYIFDSGVRRSILEPQAKTVADSMLRDYNAYAEATKKSFAGAGDLVSKPASAALEVERETLRRFLATDITLLKAVMEQALEDGDAADGRAVRGMIEKASAHVSR